MQITKINHSRKFKTNFYIPTIVSTKYLHLSKNTFSIWCSSISTCFLFGHIYDACLLLWIFPILANLVENYAQFDPKKHLFSVHEISKNLVLHLCSGIFKKIYSASATFIFTHIVFIVGIIVKDTINQLRKKEQRKWHRYNAVETVKQQENTEKQKFVLQCRGNISNEFVKKLNKIHHVQTIFTTRKFKSCLPSLKSNFDKDLISHVDYELTCNGCKSIYVG